LGAAIAEAAMRDDINNEQTKALEAKIGPRGNTEITEANQALVGEWLVAKGWPALPPEMSPLSLLDLFYNTDHLFPGSTVPHSQRVLFWNLRAALNEQTSDLYNQVAKLAEKTPSDLQRAKEELTSAIDELRDELLETFNIAQETYLKVRQVGFVVLFGMGFLVSLIFIPLEADKEFWKYSLSGFVLGMVGLLYLHDINPIAAWLRERRKRWLHNLVRSTYGEPIRSYDDLFRKSSAASTAPPTEPPQSS
jgi:hypothetical protein